MGHSVYVVGIVIFVLHFTMTLTLPRERRSHDHSKDDDNVNSAETADSQLLCRRRVASLRFNDSFPPHFKNSYEPLVACRSFSKHTCCSREDSETIKRLNLMGASAGHSARCRKFSEQFNCMSCDGDVGTGLKSTICPSFCDGWYEACKSEYYRTSMDGSTIRPCYGDFLICSPLEAIVSDGKALCDRMGVASSGEGINHIDGHCYDGVPSNKRGIPEQLPPNDDVKIGGFTFKNDSIDVVSRTLYSLKKAWDKSTELEVGIAVACLLTASFIIMIGFRRVIRNVRDEQYTEMKAYLETSVANTRNIETDRKDKVLSSSSSSSSDED